MRKYTKEFLMNSLKDLSLRLGRNPTSNDIGKKNNMPDRSVFENKFSSWNNALIVADLRINSYYRKWTKEEIIKWLNYKYKELGRTPGIRDFDNDSRTPAKNVVKRLFGNWTNALREANIPVRRFISEQELINFLKSLGLGTVH